MISKILFYSLRLSEYRWESLEMKLIKKRLNISICLCILSLSLSELSEFPQSISCFIFLWSRKRRYISRLSIILKILGFLTMVAMMWKLHSQLLFFRHHTPPPLHNRNLDHSQKARAWLQAETKLSVFCNVNRILSPKGMLLKLSHPPAMEC